MLLGVELNSMENPLFISRVHFLFIHIDRMGEEGVDEQWEEASYGDEQSWRRVNPFVRGISP